MVKLWLSCAWHGSDGVQHWFRYGLVMCVAWFRCGLCGSMVQVVVKLCVTLCRCVSVVRCMVQMQSRCAWSSVVGCSCGCVVCGMVQGWLSVRGMVTMWCSCVWFSVSGRG